MNLSSLRRRLTVFSIAYIVIFHLWGVYWHRIGHTTMLTVGGFIFSLIGSIWILSLLYLSFRVVQKRERYFWLILIGSFLSYFIGELIVNLYFLNIIENPSRITNWTFLISALLHIVAIIYRINLNQTRETMLTLLLDSSITVLVISTISWLLILKPLVDQTGCSYLNLTLFMHPVLEIVIVFGVTMFIFSQPKNFPTISLALYATGMLVYFVSNWCIFQGSFVNFNVSYHYYVIWKAGLLFIGLAGLYDQPTSELKKKGKRIQRLLDYTRLVGPYFSLVLLNLLFILKKDAPQSAQILVGGIATSLVILRQILTLVENNKLVQKVVKANEVLEEKVAERTRQLSEINKELEYMAYHDPLTELANRRMFMEYLDLIISDADPAKDQFAIIFIDLDRFKNINDFYGHDTGDQLLVEVGKRIRQILRTSDLVARCGGDEFLIFLPQSEDQVYQIAEKIQRALITPLQVHDYHIMVGGSLGISLYPRDGQRLDSLLKNADIAMYSAKEQGRNQIQVYTDQLGEKVFKKNNLEMDLRNALERQELELYYQPQFEISSGKLQGVEALLRWNHPEFGRVSPGEFIPIAEESGLILPIGEWVLGEACAQARQWNQAGYDLTISVNISPKQFMQENFVAQVEEVLTKTRLNPAQLILEITESVAIYHEEQVIIKLQILKSLGAKVSVDDFGTGYSSFGYLSRLPIDTLKMDRSFFNRFPEDVTSLSIVTAIIAMAKSLNLSVVAEGVESVNQLNQLRHLGCNSAQGYLLGRPMELAAVERELSRTRELTSRSFTRKTAT